MHNRLQVLCSNPYDDERSIGEFSRKTYERQGSAAAFSMVGSVLPLQPASCRRYYTQGDVDCGGVPYSRTESVCRGLFVKKKDGSMRKHDCDPMPQDVNVPPVIA